MDPSDPDSKSDFHRTPNLDQLMQSGVRFTQGYAPESICSPSRRSILFGHTPMRQDDETFKNNYEPGKNGFLTIPQVLKKINPLYVTAHFGKWDLRIGVSPSAYGYDYSDGDNGNAQGNINHSGDEKWTTFFTEENPKQIDTLTNRTKRFISEQVQHKKPFFIQLSHYATHADITARKETIAHFETLTKGKKHPHAAWAAMLADLDASIGEVIAHLERLGIGNNTYLFFMSDNGGVEFIAPVKNRLDHPDSFPIPMRNAPLRGGKWTLFEGGIRVPFFVSGPNIPANTISKRPVTGYDLLATFAELAGSKNPNSFSLDGESFTASLSNPTISNLNRNLYFHRFNNGYPHSAIISGEYKLLKFWKTGEILLFNLHDDPGEKKNLAEVNPDKVKSMSDALDNYFKEVNPTLFNQLSTLTSK
jgi:arylsulfatase A-like enzyme